MIKEQLKFKKCLSDRFYSDLSLECCIIGESW